MLDVAEIAEDCALLGEAFQKIVSDGGLIILIFEYDDEHMVEMLSAEVRAWFRWRHSAQS